jgi:hypothetical protein
MNTERVPMNNELDSVRSECSVAALSERIFERTLSFAEIAELSEKCALWDIGKNADKTFSRPLTFVIPATQLFASVSRRVE